MFIDIRNIKCLILLVYLLIGIAIGSSQAQNTSPALPNIVYILADDLGYGDIGAYGQEKIETPNIDALAQEGMTFTQHYSGSPVCAPARYMLMTGKHPGNAYVRGNNPMAERGDVWDFEAMYENPGLEGNTPIPLETITVADILKEVGYQTGGIGKWGLGGPTIGGHPNNHGFDLFYGYLCQRQAHTYYPSHLWKNGQRILLDNELVNPKQPLPEELDPYDSDSYAPWHDQPDYSAELMHYEALRFIENNFENDTPFFLYLPTPIPHVALQAPQRWVDYYLDKFGDEEPFLGGSYPPVRYPNATYAAMISYLDEQVGEIVEKLKKLDLYENTLIVFTSDNGPVSGTGGVDPEYFNSATPFQNIRGRLKGSVYEGGIRVPMIATWKNHILAGSTTDHISAFWDIMPTFSEIAGVDPPEEIDGISFLPVLQGNEQEQHEYLYWEYPAGGGQQAVRMGQWKGIRNGIFAGNLEIELYNLEEDIREENDVADEYPDIVDRIRNIMEHEHTIPEIERFRMEALLK